jgi:hypothetical protein
MNKRDNELLEFTNNQQGFKPFTAERHMSACVVKACMASAATWRLQLTFHRVKVKAGALLALLAASLPSQADNNAAGDSPDQPHRTTQQLLQAANGGPYPSGSAQDGGGRPPKRGGVLGFFAGRGGSSAAGGRP